MSIVNLCGKNVQEIKQSLLSNYTFKDKKIAKKVSKIINKVRKNGDSSIRKFAKVFDNSTLKDFKFTQEEINSSFKKIDKSVIKSLELASERIFDYHQKQLPETKVVFKDSLETELGWQYTSIENVCLYVPGGSYAYPSSVLMNSIPAIVSGVKNLFITTPLKNNKSNDIILAASKIIGVSDVYKLGGVHAIAAFAYGSDSVPKVDLICGPGNAYVTEAKKQVFGVIGIDILAGPSEVLIISDGTSDARLVAVDLLSQAEHDELARSILVTTDEKFASKVEDEVNFLLKEYDKRKIATRSWKENGVIYLVDTLEMACDVSNIIAPEHLEIIVGEGEEKIAKKITNAGAIFFGENTPEAFGDYLAGPSHVLPTSGTARFFSGLSVFTFLKRTSLIKSSKKGFTILANDIINLAQIEGLTYHSLSAEFRKVSKNVKNT